MNFFSYMGFDLTDELNIALTLLKESISSIVISFTLTSFYGIAILIVDAGNFGDTFVGKDANLFLFVAKEIILLLLWV